MNKMSYELTPAQRHYQKLVGLQFGSVFAAIIGLMWTWPFISLLGGTLRAVFFLVLFAVGSVCLFVAIFLLVFRHPATRQSLPYFKSGTFWAKFYGVIIAECVIIFFTIRLLQAHHVNNIIFPTIVLVVGLHFYPLAYWNGNKLWYGTATLLSVAVIAVVAFAKSDQTTTIFGAPHSSTWSLVSTGAMAISMLITSAFSMVLYARESTQKSKPQLG